MTDDIHEFGQILPDRRIAKVAGIDVDVTRIPAKYTIEMMKLNQSSGDDEVEKLDRMIDLIARICQEDKPEITKELLLEKLDMLELTALTQFIMEPITARAKDIQAHAGEGTAGKNG